MHEKAGHVPKGNTKMALETRNGKGAYYTQSRKVNGRVVRTYCGSGGSALVMALYDATTRERNAQHALEWRWARYEIEAADGFLKSYFQEVKAAQDTTLEALGYHQHSRQWRKKRMAKMSLKAAIAASTAGDKQGLAAMEIYIKDFAPNDPYWACIAWPNEELLAIAITDTLDKKNLLLKKSLMQRWQQMAEQLTTKNDTPLEKLMIEQAAISWLWAHAEDMRVAHMGDQSVQHAQYLSTRQEKAARRYQNALLTLGKIRRLKLPVQQINIAQKGAQQLNITAPGKEGILP